MVPTSRWCLHGRIVLLCVRLFSAGVMRHCDVLRMCLISIMFTWLLLCGAFGEPLLLDVHSDFLDFSKWGFIQV